MKNHLTRFGQPLLADNPVMVQTLGVCSVLAVTTRADQALLMALCLTFVVSFSSFVISLFRKLITHEIRLIVQMMVVGVFVLFAEQILMAYAWSIYSRMSVFVSLIITNCIVLGRIEGFAMKHAPVESFLDALGNGLGYGIFIVLVGVLREFLGSGSLFSFQIIPQAFYEAGYKNNLIFALAPGAFFLSGFAVWTLQALQAGRSGK